jgi:hypothetical protein
MLMESCQKGLGTGVVSLELEGWDVNATRISITRREPMLIEIAICLRSPGRGAFQRTTLDCAIGQAEASKSSVRAHVQGTDIRDLLGVTICCVVRDFEEFVSWHGDDRAGCLRRFGRHFQEQVAIQDLMAWLL